ncbi:hypothetical protein Bca4012_000492 [Brassica carinata]|uniref:Uncharacterized protein n=1 Tax=Brassica carinata TaxID=52824 RepID=A0A8X7WQB4_BRACI|nr:hypothetical protein Bca52824_005516 [Brassica carinata]
MSGVWVFKNGVVRLVDRDLASRQPTKKKVLIHLPTDEVVSSHSSLEQILICCSNHDFVSFLSNLHHHFYSPSLLHVFASIFIFVRLVSPFVYLLSVPFVICVDRCNKAISRRRSWKKQTMPHKGYSILDDYDDGFDDAVHMTVMRVCMCVIFAVLFVIQWLLPSGNQIIN